MSKSIEATILAEKDYDAWDDFVAKQERTGSIYSTAKYLDILCRAAGGFFSIAATRDGDSFVAGIGIYRSRVHRHDVIANRLLLYYNGVVMRDDLLPLEGSSSGRAAAIDSLCDLLDKQGVAQITLHCRDANQDFRPFLHRGWSASPLFTLVVPTFDSRRLWKSFDHNARRLVRRAEDAGCNVDADNDFDALFRAHEEVHLRKRAPLYLPRAAFERYTDAVIAAGLGVIFSARLAGGTVAAAQLVLLGNHSSSHTVCAGSFEEHLSSGAAYLMRWRTFVNLEERGYTSNDLTDATLGGVTRFKEQLGGRLTMNMLLKTPRPLRYTFIERSSSLIRRIRDQRRASGSPG